MTGLFEKFQKIGGGGHADFAALENPAAHTGKTTLFSPYFCAPRSASRQQRGSSYVVHTWTQVLQR